MAWQQLLQVNCLCIHCLSACPLISCEPFHSMYWAASSTFPFYILIEYLKGTLPSSSAAGDTTAVTVGAFIGGAIFGAVTIVLVVGIVCGVFKLRRKCYSNNRSTKQERFVLFILTVK